MPLGDYIGEIADRLFSLNRRWVEKSYLYSFSCQGNSQNVFSNWL